MRLSFLLEKPKALFGRPNMCFALETLDIFILGLILEKTTFTLSMEKCSDITYSVPSSWIDVLIFTIPFSLPASHSSFR